MAYIKFLGAEDVRKADALPMTLHTVRITGEIEPNTGGFRLYLDEKCLYPLDNGEYESYTTLYREGEGWFELSDDESVYTSPDTEEDSGIAEPVPITLDAVRAAKLLEVSAACERVIYAGVDVILPGGTQEHFSLTEKDQINLFGKQAQLAAGVQQLEYHQDGHPCRYYSQEEMQAIITAAMQHVSYHTTYCNSLNMWIKDVGTVEEINAIYYGVEIPEIYQSEVLKDYFAGAVKGTGEDSADEVS